MDHAQPRVGVAGNRWPSPALDPGVEGDLGHAQLTARSRSYHSCWGPGPGGYGGPGCGSAGCPGPAASR